MDILYDVSYRHPNRDLLFEHIYLNIIKGSKVALIGNNGSGKSTLLKIIAEVLKPLSGQANLSSELYYIPQHFGQYDELTVAEAMKVADKTDALDRILAGDVSELNLTALADDWTIHERCREALKHWQLPEIDLSRRLKSLSGGQKARVFLAGVAIHQPDLVLMDEPTNHMDAAGRQLLYKFIGQNTSTMMVVSHDRTLLNPLDPVMELTHDGLTTYGGNYDFYKMQKELETSALLQRVKWGEKELRKAREIARDTAEKQQRLDARGKKKQEKAGLPTISLNTFRNNAEKSTARLNDVHAEKVGSIELSLHRLRERVPDRDTMKFGFDSAQLHNGKILASFASVNYAYNNQPLWTEPLSTEIRSGERIVVKGSNGAGKTTLLKMVLGALAPFSGEVFRAEHRAVYIDQDYSLIKDSLTVFEQAQQFNSSGKEESWVKTCLDRFLFGGDDWHKRCAVLSGGERMRLVLCCLTVGQQAPDMIVLDEPTNNLDIQNIRILTAAITDYKGTLMVVSHDEVFLEQIGITRVIQL